MADKKDAIWRDFAIEAVYHGRRKPVDDEWGRILEALNAVPSADVVERKRGKAIDRYDDEGWICSVCRKGLYAPDDNFCPNCGADMTEGVAENATTTDEVGDCNICRFAGCSECDDCINGSEWVREVKGVDYDCE